MLLDVSIGPYVPKKIQGYFFKLVCSRTLRVDDFEKAQDAIVEILCKLEIIFSLAFFTIMVHVMMHLPEEALEGGLVHMRWMYPFE